MKQLTLMKFKKIFEEQKANMLYSNKIFNAEFILNPDDLSDESDLSSATLEQTMRVQLRNREALFLKKIDEALLKIKARTFGSCECCEEEIEVSRLEARPTANLCIACKETQEIQETRLVDGRKSKSIGNMIGIRSA